MSLVFSTIDNISQFILKVQFMFTVSPLEYRKIYKIYENGDGFESRTYE
jgi:hypothetical protein